jgi:hypothetical protein
MHHWATPLVWSLLVVGAFVPVHWVEEAVLGPAGSPRRMAGNPTELAMRVVGLSHHVVAAVFLLTRLRLRAPSTWGRLIALIALGALGCVGFAAFGGRLNPVTLALFYILFQVHAFPDEALFYRYYEGDAVGTGRRVKRNLVWVQVAAAGVLGLVLPAYVLFTRVVGYADTPAWLGHLPFKVLPAEVAALETAIPSAWSHGLVLLLTTAPSIVLIMVALSRLHADPAGLRGVWRAHGRLIKVLASSLGLIFSSVCWAVGRFPS